MAGKKITNSVKSIKVALTIISKSTKDAGFYCDSAADVYMTYNHLLFSIYNEAQLFLIPMANNSKLKVLGKDNVFLIVMIDDEAPKSISSTFFIPLTWNIIFSQSVPSRKPVTESWP